MSRPGAVEVWPSDARGKHSAQVWPGTVFLEDVTPAKVLRVHIGGGQLEPVADFDTALAQPGSGR